MKDIVSEQIWFVKMAVHGLAELDQFQDLAQREGAFRDLAVRSTRWRRLRVVGVVIVLFAVLAVYFLQKHFQIWTSRFGLSRWTSFVAMLAFVVFPALIVTFVLFRRQARRELRELLILRDVPVCRGCGYSLRGQPAESERCPECGRAIRDDVRRIITGPQRFDLPYPPPSAETKSPHTSNPAESEP